MKPQTSQQFSARRREAANLALKGWTQVAIAKQLQVPQGTVSRDLAAMRDFWRDFPVYEFDKVRLEQLQKIDLVEAEAWAAWQRSQGQRHTASLTRSKTGEQTRTTLQDQYGDPRQLREVARCVAQRSEMIGVQPPEPPPERAKVEIPECAPTEHFRYYLLLRERFGEPPYNPVGGLNAEHYADLVAEHEQDPYFHKAWSNERAQQDPGAPNAAAAAPPGQNEEQPDNLQPGVAGQADSACSHDLHVLPEV